VAFDDSYRCFDEQDTEEHSAGDHLCMLREVHLHLQPAVISSTSATLAGSSLARKRADLREFASNLTLIRLLPTEKLQTSFGNGRGVLRERGAMISD
jgi:hypothetical protein